MLKAILFRGGVITAAIMGGLCFVEGYIAAAACLWLLGAVAFFFLFPLIEGNAALRKGRMLAYLVPILFFVISSGLVLLSREGMQRYFTLLPTICLVYITASVALMRRKNK